MEHTRNHLAAAKRLCLNVWSDKPTDAADELGTALHPLQDYYAHGAFGHTERGSGDLWVAHNQKAPRYSLPAGYTDPVDIVDDPGFDVYGSPDEGRPVEGGEEGRGITSLGFHYEWYVFIPGGLRIAATERETRRVLEDYYAHLRAWATDCCKCKRYFGY